VRPALLVQEDVSGLEVAVEDAATVRVMHGPGHGGDEARDGVRGGPVGHASVQRRERPPLDELHGEVVLSLVLADLVNGDDVRVVELGGRLRLAAKSVHLVCGGELSGEDHLQRYDAVEAALPRFVDDAHAAAGDFLQQLVVAEIGDGAERTVGHRVAGGEGWVLDGGGRRRGLTHAVVVAEERLEVSGQIGMAGEKFGAVGRSSHFDGFEVGGDDFVEARLAGHGSFRFAEKLAQGLQAAL
jgi:hypothetical protein